MVGAEVADLNGNGLPQMDVFVQGSSSGSNGELVAYSAIKGSERSPITLQELSGAAAEGFQGHDRFDGIESCLVRQFLIYKPGDNNAKATGGKHQICDKLKTGEAVWILRPSNLLKV